MVVIGRNDNHGYNLHKRVASSLNSIANILNDEDEIIFVDWNTPEDMPALLISIGDTLTAKAKKVLRLITIDPEIHSKVSQGSHRKLLEPIARNVGIRMSDSDSDWVLSTNTDMLFYFPNAKKLDEILKDREPALFTMFRNEIPEYFWDSLERNKPEKTRIALSRLANSPVRRNILLSNTIESRFIHYPDGVGDFQLAPRSFWFEMKGFAEDKLLGWHNDTRLVIQMAKKLKCRVELLSPKDIVGFHQNHYRSLVEGQDNSNVNSTSVVFSEYNNGDTWGLSEEKHCKVPYLVLEKETKESYLLSERLPTSDSNVSEITESLESIHNSLTDDYRRLLFFLQDDISILKSGGRVIYIGWNFQFFESLSSVVDKNLEVIDCGVSEKAETTFEYINLLQISHKDILLIDLGLDSRRDSDRELNDIGRDFGTAGGMNEDDWRRLAISNAKLIPILGKYLHENQLQTKVGFLRNQNWPTLQLSKCYFSLPLFNNYSGYLSGRVKGKFSSDILRRTFLSASVSQYLTLQKREISNTVVKEWTTPRVMSILMTIRPYQLYKRLPNRIKSPIRRIAFRFFS